MTKAETRATLNKDALQYYREHVAGLSQQGLADRSRAIGSPISKSQISRWERGKQTGNIRQNSRKALERALDVRWEVLTRPPEHADADRMLRRIRVPLTEGMAGSARTALTFMQLHYGLLEEAIIDLAPLAFLILAERSLKSRQALLDETVGALEAATGEAYRRLPYLRGAFFAAYDYDWIETERKSLKERAVYEQYVDDEGEEMSPFVDFLEKELKALGLFQKYPIEFSSNYRNAPNYAIPAEVLAPVLGLDATDEADQRVLGLIQTGHIDFRKAWDKKKEATEEGYRNWLVEQLQVADEEYRRTFPEHDLILFGDIPAGAKSDGDDTDSEEQA